MTNNKEQPRQLISDFKPGIVSDFSSISYKRNLNLATERRNQAYAELIKRGWEWRTNTSLSDVGRHSEIYARAGLAVYVSQQAFDGNGQRLKDCVAILTRR